MLQLEEGLTLDMAANTTTLPFMIAAAVKHGREQFMCPVIGKAVPHLQDNMCDKSYVSYKEKYLRVAIFGVPPYFYGKSDFNITRHSRSPCL